MELVIDANILMSSLVKARGFTYDLIFNEKIKLYAPEYLLEEFEEHREEILKKSNLTEEELELFLSLVSQKIEFIPLVEFEEFDDEASQITPDPDDTEYFSLALKLNCPIWSNDKKLKAQNKVRIYSTEELIKIL
ncbi:PIN domain-containing protein [Nanoarchaeota archaeon]